MLTIERAKIEDANKITEIKTRAFNKEINTYLGRDGGPPGYDKIESQEYITNNFIAYKILLDNKIIGGLFLIVNQDSSMCLEDFVIDPIHQGKGYGYSTMQMVEELYPDCKEWRLSTPIFSVGNQHLYQKFGYIEVSRDEDLIYYVKKLNV